MVWLIVIVALAVLGVVAMASTGRLGEMPPVVNDRPKGIVPPGPVDHDFIRTVRFPTAPTGYNPEQVMAYLELVADGKPVAEPTFDLCRSGYDMQTVDAIVERAMLPPELYAEDYFQTVDEPEGSADPAGGVAPAQELEADLTEADDRLPERRQDGVERPAVTDDRAV